MDIDPRSYNIIIRYDDFEGEMYYEARVKEFPHIMEYSDIPDKAYELAVNHIEYLIHHMTEKGREIPEPINLFAD